MLNFSLLGCGRIAERYAQLLKSEIAGARLAAVCDEDPVRAEAFGKRYAVPCFSDMHDMMRGAPVDVACLLTPSGYHANHCLELSRYKKTLVVEKPLALTIEDADRMILACEREDVRLFVVKQYRFHPPVIELKRALEAGRFGKLMMASLRLRWLRSAEYYRSAAWRGSYELDGGVLANQASHHIDLLGWFMGDVKSVFTKGKTFLAPIEAEDTAVSVIEFVSGAYGVIEATTATHPENIEGSVSVMGERGTVEIGGFSADRLKYWKFDSVENYDADVFKRCMLDDTTRSGYGHRRFLEHVVDCVLHDKQPSVSVTEARQGVRLIAALYESLATGREVSLSEAKLTTHRLGRRS